MYVCMCVCMYVCVYVCMYVCVYVCVCVCVCVSRIIRQFLLEIGKSMELHVFAEDADTLLRYFHSQNIFFNLLYQTN
jgi:hypothetical protein